MSKKLFLDTCVLLDLQQKAFETHFYISSITLTELENIKTSINKDEEIKWKARQVLHLLQDNNNYEVISYNTQTYDPIIEHFGLILNNDSRIIATVYSLKEEVIFATADMACFYVAKSIGINCKLTTIEDKEEEYLGYKTVQMEDDDLVYFYSQILKNNENPYELKNNEYLLITDMSNKIIDKYRWYDNQYKKILFNVAESRMFGKITPKDDYQQIALDSLKNNQITMLRGPAGSGKSYISFGYMFDLLEHGQIDKVIVFCNTVATKGSAKLGYYPGSRTEKLLDSQIGNLLESKIGDRIEVERLIAEGQLVLLPLSDIRGYDTTGMNAAIYISEAQNLDIEMMRLALQRIGEDSICIIDGDDRTQVDMSMYAGTRNGMKRVSKVFRNSDFYGEVTLKHIHRSKIAKLAQEL